MDIDGNLVEISENVWTMIKVKRNGWKCGGCKSKLMIIIPS